MSEETAIEKIQAALTTIPYARYLGVQVVFNGDEMTGVLPFAEKLIDGDTVQIGQVVASIDEKAAPPAEIAARAEPPRAPDRRPP